MQASSLASALPESGARSTSSEACDAERARAFALRVQGILDQGALALMLSIGHRAGLFDALRGQGFLTPEALAERAGLEGRYVREWLAALATGGIVQHDPGRGAFRLPPEHAAALTRDARRNLAATAQWIPLLAGAEDAVLACFERGGGVPHGAYERFHEVMAEDTDRRTAAQLERGILPLVPGLAPALERGIDVLDVGCGRGGVLLALAQRFPASRFTGYELSAGAVAEARSAAAHLGLRNARFEVRDVADLELRGRFDLVTAFDAIHDLAEPSRVLERIAGALRPGGVLLMQELRGSSRIEEDAALPLATFFYTVSCLHCVPVSLHQGGEALGAMWGARRAQQMLERAGFAEIAVHALEDDPLAHCFVARPRA